MPAYTQTAFFIFVLIDNVPLGQSIVHSTPFPRINQLRFRLCEMPANASTAPDPDDMAVLNEVRIGILPKLAMMARRDRTI